MLPLLFHLADVDAAITVVAGVAVIAAIAVVATSIDGCLWWALLVTDNRLVFLLIDAIALSLLML